MEKAKKYLKELIFALLIVVFIRTFFFQAYRIPTGSMEPTLLPGDFLFANRLAYGIRIPYSKYAIMWKKPQRGDVVIFVYKGDRKKDFIKRVIAVEGETIEIKNKKIYINGREIEDKWGYFSDGENIGYPRDDFGPYEVPNGYVFVMGDNRDESNDSRYWGVVNINDIKGKAGIIYFSFGCKMEEIKKPNCKKTIRFERIFRKIR